MSIGRTFPACASRAPEAGRACGLLPPDRQPGPIDFTRKEFLPALRALVGCSSPEPAARAFACVAAWLQRPLSGAYPRQRGPGTHGNKGAPKDLVA